MRESLLYPPSYSVLSSSAWKSRFCMRTKQMGLYVWVSTCENILEVVNNPKLTHPAATYKQLNFLWSKQVLQWRLISNHVKSSSEGLELFLHTFVQHVLCIECHKILQRPTSCYVYTCRYEHVFDFKS